MKNFAKRSLAMLMALVMCVSLLSGIAVNANAVIVDYVTGTPANSGYIGVIKNWGKRGATATFLSPNAESFYERNDITYDDLAELSGASNISAVPSSALYAELKGLMASNHETITSYGDVRYLMSYTDCQENGTGTNGTYISSFYSGTNIGPSWDGGDTWNREHTWPNSKGLEGDDENDIMMLRPSSVSENSSRGNRAYGEGSSYYNPNIGSYNLHGDVARIMLYTYVRWGNTSKMWGSSGVMESKEILLKWMEEDPVDTWELARNDSVESITGTRNVFVDYPELAFLLFNEEIPNNMATPSGEAAAQEFVITATVNNNRFGTVTLSGNKITAFPATGYGVAGYEITSGSATVEQSGNVFTVTASSDCTVQINFAAKVEAQLAFVQNGKTVSSQTAYTGNVITLPGHSGATSDGYVFLGWVTDELEESEQMPSTVFLAGDTYALTQDVTFYALYSRVDTTAANGSAYALATEIAEGDYLIVADSGAMKAEIDTERFAYTDVSIANCSVSTPDASVIWHIAPTQDGYYTIYNESTGSYAAGTGASNKGKLLTAVTDYAKWTITFDATGTPVFTNLGNLTKGVNSTLRRNLQFGFAAYDATTGTAPCLYKKTTNTVLYGTRMISCLHSNTEQRDQVAASCTVSGSTGNLVCLDCGSLLNANRPVAATGHIDANSDTICDGCGGSLITYKKVTNLSVGDTVLLVCESRNVELSAFSTTSTTYGIGTAYEDLPEGLMPLTVVAGTSDGTFAFKNGNNYLYWASGNSLKKSTSLSKNSSWLVSFDDDGNAIILNAADTARKLRWNASSPRFACYTASEQTAVQFYGLTVAEAPACQHSNTQLQNVVAGSCTTDGYTGDQVCLDCGETVTPGTVITAPGHNYEAFITEPTDTDEGYTTYTCTCGESYVDDYTAPLSAVAKIGTTYYSDLSDALDTANNISADKVSVTVVLIADGHEEKSYLTIDANVTLDMGAYDVYAKSLNVLTGGKVSGVEYKQGADWAKIHLPSASRMVMSGIVIKNDGSIGTVPVWDAEASCYVFGGAFFKASNYEVAVNETKKTISFKFFPSLRTDLMKGYFQDANEMRDNGLRLVLRLTWPGADENGAINGEAQQDFVYSSEFVKTYMEKLGAARFTFLLTGYDTMITEEALSEMTITPMLIADNGMVFAGETIEIADYTAE